MAPTSWRCRRLYTAVGAVLGSTAYLLVVSNYETTGVGVVGSSSRPFGNVQPKSSTTTIGGHAPGIPQAFTEEEENELRSLSDSTAMDYGSTTTEQNNMVSNESLDAAQDNSTSMATMAPTNYDRKDLVYLPLWPWEYESLQPSRTCQPPLGTPDYCCLGSLSKTAQVYYAHGPCNHSLATYEAAEQLALASMPPIDNVVQSKTVIRCDVCRMVDILMERNWTMAMQGDSVTRQSFFGLECELRRRNLYQVERVQLRGKGHKSYDAGGLDDVHELRISPLPSTDTDSNASSLSSRRHCRCPTWL
jgi:hypothetical protein